MSQVVYDAIVIGARVAGSPTAMLLARKGYRVLLVDRASFPSDTMSTHQIQLPGGAALKRWGLLERVVATGLPVAERVRMEMDGMVVGGRFPVLEGSLASTARAATCSTRSCSTRRARRAPRSARTA